jgi:multidrug efflux pump subunit AcrB
MEKIIRWFVNNSVATNLIMVFIIISGALTIPLIKMEVFPEIEVDIINISALYPGASPNDVESAICIKIEEKLQGLEGIKNISAVAVENVGNVSVELLPNQDINKILDRIKVIIDGIQTFPVDVETPVVTQILTSQPTITIAISGDIDNLTLSALTDNIKDEIDNLSGITYTSIVAKREKEITIEVSKANLQKYNLTLQMISDAINSWSIDIPSGSILNQTGEILIKAKGQKYRIEDFEEIPIIINEFGQYVPLRDLAEIADGFALSYDLEFDFNGKPANLITVYRVGNQNAIEIAKIIKDFVLQKQNELPQSVSITAWDDEARLLEGRVDLMVENAKYGLLLVIIVLALFLKPKLAFWVSLGIPISFMGGFMFMPFLDISINMLSLFTFILVLGIVVDDAVIVGENFALFKERGMNSKEAAITATKQVSKPVFFAVLTTMVTFSPMLFVKGDIGSIWRIFPLITISVLFWSLFESLTILPSHLAHSKEKIYKNIYIAQLSNKWEVFQNKIKNLLYTFIENFYKPILKKAVNNPVTFLCICASIFILTIGVIAGGLVKFSFFPPIEADLAIASIEYPKGTSIELTRKGYNQLENATEILEDELKKEFPGEVIIKNRLSTIGFQPMRTKTSRGPGNLTGSYGGSNMAEVALELVPGEDRKIGSEEVVRRWREIMPKVIGIENISFFSNLFSAGDPINIQLSSIYLDDLVSAKDKLKIELGKYPGVFDISDNFTKGKEELLITLLPIAKLYGINMIILGNQIRQAFYGYDVQTIQRGKDEVKVVLRFPDKERNSIADLENMMIATSSGLTIPVKQIAKLEIVDGLSTIKRKNRKRTINITADVDLNVITGNEVIESVVNNFMPELMNQYNSINYTLEGEQQEQGQNLESIGKNFIIAMIIVYILLAIPFKSYFQPLIIMSSIPFGLTGALIGHLIMGINFSVLSLMGFVALTGVVVNDSLVMVDFINRYRNDGNTITQAVLEAGPRRFRAIFLTSLTTFVGLVPLLFEKSAQAKFIIPMAVSLSFGVIFATFITLLLVPVFYLVLEKYLIKSESAT